VWFRSVGDRPCKRSENWANSAARLRLVEPMVDSSGAKKTPIGVVNGGLKSGNASSKGVKAAK
jgi:hypothetical protein